MYTENIICPYFLIKQVNIISPKHLIIVVIVIIISIDTLL